MPVFMPSTIKVNNDLEFVLVLFHFNAGGIRLKFQLCYILQVLIVGKC